MKNGSLPRAFRETEFKQMDTLLYRKEKGGKRARILSFSYSLFFFCSSCLQADGSFVPAGYSFRLKVIGAQTLSFINPA